MIWGLEMPRKIVLDAEWMRRARYNGWAVNYERRKYAVVLGDMKCLHVLRVIDRFDFPPPQMELSGWLDKEASGLMMSEQVREACQASGLPLANYEYLARWYWSRDDWQVYVSAYQQLPDPEGIYTFSWEGRFIPKVVPMGAVDKPVDNLGTSGGKSALVPVPRELVARGWRM